MTTTFSYAVLLPTCAQIAFDTHRGTVLHELSHAEFKRLTDDCCREMAHRGKWMDVTDAAGDTVAETTPAETT